MAARFWVLGTGTWDASDTTHWATVSGAGSGGASVPGSADTVTIDSASGAGTITVNTNFNVTSITADTMTMTLDFSANNNSPTMQTFRSSGSGIRTINAGSGTWSITGNNTTVWSTATATNLTWTQTGAINCTYALGVGTRTLGVGNTAGGSEANAPSISITAGTDIVTFSTASNIMNLDFTGFAGTLTNQTRNIFGNLTFSATMTTTAASITTMAATSGTKLIKCNGNTIDFPITINGIGGTFKAGDNLTMGSTRTLILTNGTFDGNGFAITAGLFQSSNSNIRTLTFGAGQWTMTGNAVSVWNMGTSTNAAITPGLPVILSYSGSVGTRTFSTGATADVTQTSAVSFNITAGSDIITTSNNRVVGSLDFTGFSGSWTTLATSFYGNLTMPSNMGQTVASNFTFLGTATKTITTNGNANCVFSLILNGPSGQVNLGSNFTTTGNITVTAGGFSTNNFNVMCGIFSSSNSNTRTITFGSSTVTLMSTGIVWNTGVITGLTFNVGTSTLVINNVSATEKEIATNTITFNNLYFAGGGTGDLFIRPLPSPVTFNNIKVDAGMTINFFGGSTTNVTSLTIVGRVGSLVTLQSSGAGVKWFLNSTTGVPLAVQYASIQDSTASPPSFVAYSSVDVSNNVGWLFKPLSVWTDVPKPSNTTILTQEGTPIGLLLALTYATNNTTVKGWTDVVKPSGTTWTDINKPSGTTWSNVN